VENTASQVIEDEGENVREEKKKNGHLREEMQTGRRGEERVKGSHSPKEKTLRVHISRKRKSWAPKQNESKKNTCYAQKGRVPCV